MQQMEEEGPRMKTTPKILLLVVLVGLAAGVYFYLNPRNDDNKNAGLTYGNGRIEATEIDIATKLAGKIEKILVGEGDYVEEGQLLAVMQTTTLEAERAEARAQLQKAVTDEKSAQAQVALRESDKKVSQALVKERQSALDAAQRRYNRSKVLVAKKAVPVEEFDNDETNLSGARAAVASAKAQVDVSQAAIDAAKADVNGKRADIKAAEARIARIEADIADCQLKAPRSGRIQYRIAQAGEVIGAGGKVLNLVDLSDVYMTFYLPETATGLVALSDDARIVLDAAPDRAIPARISFVASVAQFTPKTVETQVERQKLMFRVKAQIDRAFLEKHIDYVKTGLPGVTWVRIDPEAKWPENLTPKESD